MTPDQFPDVKLDEKQQAQLTDRIFANGHAFKVIVERSDGLKISKDLPKSEARRFIEDFLFENHYDV